MKLRDKRFLTSDELTYVINGVENGTDEFSKEILKVALVAQIVIEDVNWDEYETCNDIYDVVMEEESKEDGFCLAIDIENYYAIDEILRREHSVEKTVERFLYGLNKKIDEYAKRIDVGQLEGLLNELKNLEVENEEAKEIVVEE